MSPCLGLQALKIFATFYPRKRVSKIRYNLPPIAANNAGNFETEFFRAVLGHTWISYMIVNRAFAGSGAFP